MRLRVAPALAALALLLGPVAAEEPKPSDPPAAPEPEPLPDKAVARLGTSRWRHADEVTGVAFSPEGRVIASCGKDRTVRICQVKDGKQLQKLEHPEPVSSLAYSWEGRFVAAGCEDRSLYLWDSITGKLVKRLDGHS